jgi:hypothetical protein
MDITEHHHLRASERHWCVENSRQLLFFLVRPKVINPLSTLCFFLPTPPPCRCVCLVLFYLIGCLRIFLKVVKTKEKEEDVYRYASPASSIRPGNVIICSDRLYF